jgi:geranylgeranyl reductase family protein
METATNGTSRGAFEVVVVGSGPAGALAAIDLARHGISVCLVERVTHPRYKPCGGGVLARAIHHLPVDVEYAADHACHVVELHFTGKNLSFRTERSMPVISMIMRSEFDRILVTNALKCGVVIRENTQVKGLALEEDRVVLQTGREQISGRFVVAADGVDSIVARAGGWPANHRGIPALECEVPVDTETLARFAGIARFDMDHPRHGYSWVFPKMKHLSVGVLSTHRGDTGLKEAFQHYLRRLAIEPAGPLELHGAQIPIRPRHALLARGRVLLVGDAAGLADPITAEGITHALLSGKLAARALVDGELDVATVADRYCRLLEESILDELGVARRLAQFFYGHPTLRSLLFRSHGQRFCEKITDIMMGERRYEDFDLSAGVLARHLKLWKKSTT